MWCSKVAVHTCVSRQRSCQSGVGTHVTTTQGASLRAHPREANAREGDVLLQLVPRVDSGIAQHNPGQWRRRLLSLGHVVWANFMGDLRQVEQWGSDTRSWSPEPIFLSFSSTAPKRMRVAWTSGDEDRRTLFGAKGPVGGAPNETAGHARDPPTGPVAPTSVTVAPNLASNSELCETEPVRSLGAACPTPRLGRVARSSGAGPQHTPNSSQAKSAAKWPPALAPPRTTRPDAP